VIFVQINKSIEKNQSTYKTKIFQSFFLFSKYYQEYYGEKFTDLTFLIIEDNKVLGYVLCYVLDRKLTLPDSGVIVRLIDMNDKEKKQFYNKILDHLHDLGSQYRCETITIKNYLNKGCLSVLGEQLINRKYQTHLNFDMEIRYTDFNENNFHKNLRKSYKSLINWGKKELKVMYINKDNLDFENLRRFQDFHCKISGRKTRSDESWQIQYEMIQEGFGELALARYNDSLVAGSLFADYGDTSIYFTGVYERDLFDFGLSHFLLYDGICRSHKRGNTSRFSLGYFDTNIKDPKWHNIHFFKKGFCEELRPTILWSKEIEA
jgi:hypothetical protein